MHPGGSAHNRGRAIRADDEARAECGGGVVAGRLTGVAVSGGDMQGHGFCSVHREVHLADNSCRPDVRAAGIAVLVKLDSSRIDYSKAKANGDDLRFIDAGNAAILSYEIESWNPSGISYIWVKVPKIDRQSSNDFIHLYYGNAAAPAGQNRNGVWTRNFVGVWHLHNDLQNSVSASHNGINSNSTDAAGKIGNGQAFNGSNQWVTVPHGSALSFTATQSYSVSAWANVPSLGNRYQGVVAKSSIIAPWYGIWESPANEWVYGSSAGNIDGSAVATGWHFISLVQDASLNKRYLYVDAVKVGEAGAADANGPGDLYFGRADEFANEYFQGALDEISVSNAARSNSWIRAQYSSAQDQFVTYSADLPTAGLSGTASVLVRPQTTTWNFTSVPSGLEVVLYGRPQTTPFSRQVIVNGVSTISATSPQTVGNTQYTFSSWSDGGAQTHLVTASTLPQTYTATFSSAGGSLPETIWHSYDVATQSGSPQATLRDSLGLKTTTLEFYESVNNGGVDKGGLLSLFVPGLHAEGFNLLEKFWTVSSAYPYAGKSSVNRGSDTGETNTPAPAGVRDLQLHPPENGHLVVAAFKVPEPGAYSVYNLAARRPSSGGATVRYKVFNAQKSLIVNLQATNSSSWARDPQTYNLGNLIAGDTLYFAVDRDGTYTFDAAEIAWTIKRTGQSQTTTTTLNFQSVPSGLQLVVSGTAQTTPFSRQVIGKRSQYHLCYLAPDCRQHPIHLFVVV